MSSESPEGPHERLVGRLRQLVMAVAEQRWSEFDMRVPAEPERDADLVLFRAAAELDRLRAEVVTWRNEAYLMAAHQAIDNYQRILTELGRLRAENERLRETLRGIADADWRSWQELADPSEFVRWAKSRARHALTPNVRAKPATTAGTKG